MKNVRKSNTNVNDLEKIRLFLWKRLLLWHCSKTCLILLAQTLKYTFWKYKVYQLVPKSRTLFNEIKLLECRLQQSAYKRILILSTIYNLLYFFKTYLKSYKDATISNTLLGIIYENDDVKFWRKRKNALHR